MKKLGAPAFRTVRACRRVRAKTRAQRVRGRETRAQHVKCESETRTTLRSRLGFGRELSRTESRATLARSLTVRFCFVEDRPGYGDCRISASGRRWVGYMPAQPQWPHGRLRLRREIHTQAC